MKSFFVFVIVQAVALSVNAQCLRSCGPNLLAAPVAAPIAAPLAGPLAAALAGPCVGPAVAPTLSTLTALGPNAVANSLADTLSLLTVSSLLAEKLPLGYPAVGPVGCGCGNPLGYSYVV
ncbi:unnamed protein product [Pieris macdunnoughi]|uniref:Uncharacterized protein n=1 Tax=Pieris macdunnoughi TaxID=345717 RepID=A0A821R0I1_9NEOP|nr:unnamed protein product [Pieris macdunnoughi]